MGTARRRLRRLSTQIFVAQLAILTITTVVGFALFVHAERGHLDGQYQYRAAAIAQSVAGAPLVGRCIVRPDPACRHRLETFATDVEHTTGASYVVLIGMNRVRFTHPDPRLIGQKVTEPIATLDGRTHVGIDVGSTGRSANAKVPLYGPGGVMVGEVSVGLRDSSISAAFWAELPSYAIWFGIALGVGALASWALGRRLKNRTFGLELDEIAGLLQDREATLHAIREGVIAFDPSGRIRVINDEAQRLLQLPVSVVGRRLDDVLPTGRLLDVLSGAGATEDEIVLTDDYCLIINRTRVSLKGRHHGAVATLRDRTETVGILRELDGERRLIESVRAQQHEFANRMHTVAGLLELGRTDDALTFVTEIRGTAAQFDDTVRTHIASPQLVGLLLGKAAEAGERGIELVISPDTWLSDSPHRVHALTTIVGNLVDNAFDAVAAIAPPRRVAVEIVESEDGLLVCVRDNGTGIAPDLRRMIFEDGFSTKPRIEGRHGGMGLALLRRLVTRLDGTVTVTSDDGAEFRVWLPPLDPPPVAESLPRIDALVPPADE